MNPLNKKTYVLFLLSPFFSAPFVFKSVYERSKGSLFLVVLLFGVLSFAYIPKIGNDKEYYYQLYEQLNYLSFSQFLIYISLEKTDFIFYFLIYVFNVIGIPLQFLFLLITTLTVGLLLTIFKGVCTDKVISDKAYFLFFLMIICSLSLPGLLSGVRFYFAASICLYGFYLSIYKGRHFVGVLMVLLGALTHFSIIVFFVLLLFKPFWLRKHFLCKLFFVVSFLGVLLPRSSLLDITSSVSPSEAYTIKAEAYLGETEYLEMSLSQGNFNNRIKYFLKTFWVYFAFIYIILTWRLNSINRNLFFVFMGLSNLFFSAPTVYNRFVILAQFFFLINFFEDWFQGFRFKRMALILLFVLASNLLFNAVAMREVLKNSYFDIEVSNTVTLLLKKDITSSEIE